MPEDLLVEKRSEGCSLQVRVTGPLLLMIDSSEKISSSHRARGDVGA